MMNDIFPVVLYYCNGQPYNFVRLLCAHELTDDETFIIYLLIVIFMQSRNIWQQLASNGKSLICPRCGYEWEPRIPDPKGCPCCRLIFHK